MSQPIHDPQPSRTRRLLIADDDGHIREVVHFALTRAGYDVTLAADGRQAWDLFDQALKKSDATPAFDLVVLDILMPGLDGLDVCRRIREKSRVPLIFVSSKDEELDRILGLELGADDYLTKPFSPRELVARIKASLRRYDELHELLQEKLAAAQAAEPPDASPLSPTTESALRHGPLQLDLRRHECSVNGQAVTLTVSEFALLKAIVASDGRVLSRQRLVALAYGDDHFLSDRTVDSHIRRIRKKLTAAGHQCVETVYGVGYRLVELS